jgi:hypothetical protein
MRIVEYPLSRLLNGAGFIMALGEATRVKTEARWKGTVLSTTIALLMLLPAGFYFSGQVQALQPAPSSCSQQELLDRELAIGGSVNETMASQTARTFLANLGLGSSTPWLYNSEVNSLALDTSTCSFSLQTVGVVFNTPAYAATRQLLTVTESPGLSAVVNLTLAEPGGTSAQAGGGWTGYEFNQSTEPVSGSWYVPSILGSEDHNCGYGQGGIGGLCVLAIWAGLTNTSGGAGLDGAAYLAQAGTDLWLDCTSSSGSCAASYFNWYQFLPNETFSVKLSQTVSPGDLVTELTYYNSTSKLYSIDLDDETRGEYEEINGPPGEMGPPGYGEFQAEDPLICGTTTCGVPPLPDFSEFTPEIADPLGHDYSCGTNCLLHQSYSPYRETPDIELSGLFYGKVVRPGNCISYTCYNLSWTPN